jgi:hypothetical protein
MSEGWVIPHSGQQWADDRWCDLPRPTGMEGHQFSGFLQCPGRACGGLDPPLRSDWINLTTAFCSVPVSDLPHCFELSCLADLLGIDVDSITES